MPIKDNLKYFKFLGSAKIEEYWAVLAVCFFALVLVTKAGFDLMPIWELTLDGSPNPFIIQLIVKVPFFIAIFLAYFAVAARRCRNAHISPYWPVAIPALAAVSGWVGALVPVVTIGFLPDKTKTLTNESEEVNNMETNGNTKTNETRVVIESKSTVAGIMALVIGFIGVFILSFILSPLALILGIVALLQGGTSNIVTGVIGIVLAVVGAITSPILMGLLGVGSLLAL